MKNNRLLIPVVAVFGCVPERPEAPGAPEVESDAAVTGVDAAPRADAGPPCGTLLATIRDFRAGHPDFESFTADAVLPGLVEPVLGADGKPVYAPAGPTAHTSGAEAFAAWYRDVPSVNRAVAARIELVDQGAGAYVFEDRTFFPVDGRGFADSAIANDGLPHNFHFTTEVRTSFVYQAGQTFTFIGDDDLWLFVNGRLALDLGGLHQAAAGVVDMSARAAELGLVAGERFALDIFHAERHTTASTFRIETTIDCFIVD
jgi:fibro-slime domain-containing protein